MSSQSEQKLIAEAVASGFCVPPADKRAEFFGKPNSGLDLEKFIEEQEVLKQAEAVGFCIIPAQTKFETLSLLSSKWETDFEKMNRTSNDYWLGSGDAPHSSHMKREIGSRSRKLKAQQDEIPVTGEDDVDIGTLQYESALSVCSEESLDSDSSSELSQKQPERKQCDQHMHDIPCSLNTVYQPIIETVDDSVDLNNSPPRKLVNFKSSESDSKQLRKKQSKLSSQMTRKSSSVPFRKASTGMLLGCLLLFILVDIVFQSFCLKRSFHKGTDQSFVRLIFDDCLHVIRKTFS